MALLSFHSRARSTTETGKMTQLSRFRDTGTLSISKLSFAIWDREIKRLVGAVRANGQEVDVGEEVDGGGKTFSICIT